MGGDRENGVVLLYARSSVAIGSKKTNIAYDDTHEIACEPISVVRFARTLDTFRHMYRPVRGVWSILKA